LNVSLVRPYPINIALPRSRVTSANFNAIALLRIARRYRRYFASLAIDHNQYYRIIIMNNILTSHRGSPFDQANSEVVEYDVTRQFGRRSTLVKTPAAVVVDVALVVCSLGFPSWRIVLDHDYLWMDISSLAVMLYCLIQGK
jgi:hypothetical protein